MNLVLAAVFPYNLSQEISGAKESIEDNLLFFSAYSIRYKLKNNELVLQSIWKDKKYTCVTHLELICAGIHIIKLYLRNEQQ